MTGERWMPSSSRTKSGPSAVAGVCAPGRDRATRAHPGQHVADRPDHRVRREVVPVGAGQRGAARVPGTVAHLAPDLHTGGRPGLRAGAGDPATHHTGRYRPRRPVPQQPLDHRGGGASGRPLQRDRRVDGDVRDPGRVVRRDDVPPGDRPDLAGTRRERHAAPRPAERGGPKPAVDPPEPAGRGDRQPGGGSARGWPRPAPGTPAPARSPRAARRPAARPGSRWARRRTRRRAAAPRRRRQPRPTGSARPRRPAARLSRPGSGCRWPGTRRPSVPRWPRTVRRSAPPRPRRPARPAVRRNRSGPPRGGRAPARRPERPPPRRRGRPAPAAARARRPGRQPAGRCSRWHRRSSIAASRPSR